MQVRKTYYVEAPPLTAHSRWHVFEHTLDFPGANFDVRFDAIEGDPARSRLSITGTEPSDADRMDTAVRRFRLFLEDGPP